MAQRKTQARAKAQPNRDPVPSKPAEAEQPESVAPDAPVVPEVLEDATVTKTGHERPVEKVRGDVWWCPYCDHSQPVDFTECQNPACTAKRKDA